MNAKLLYLLRHDANKWWYFQALRKQGEIEKAKKLERAAILDNVKTIRENINREWITHRLDCIEFLDRGNGTSYTVSISGCHAGFFAAWIYCYANQIGKK